MMIRSAAVALTVVLVLAGGLAAGGAEPSGADNRDRIPELKEDAQSGLTQERLKALEALGAISDEGRLTRFSVPDFLLGILNKDANNSMVREAAADALARIVRYVPAFTDKALRPMVVRLQDRGREALSVRRRIAAAMATFLDPEAIGHRAAFAALVAIASSQEEPSGLVAEALRTLGRTGYAPAINAVTAALQSREPEVRSAALEALEALLSSRVLQRPEDVVNLLVRIVTDAKLSKAVRIRAMQALAATLRAGVPVKRVAAPLVTVLNKACEEKQPELAKAVIRALHRVPDDDSVAALRKAHAAFKAQPKSPGFDEVRVAVALTLGEYFHPLAISNDAATAGKVAKALIDIRGKEPATGGKVLRAAVFSMGLMDSTRLDRREVVGDLIENVLGGRVASGSLKQEAHAALVRLTGKDLGEDPEDWKKWYEANKAALAPQR
jgi:HEAT repeat protein